MNNLTRSAASAVVAIAFCCANVSALAMPKAAEDESAQVSTGDNAARPKLSSSKPKAAASQKKSAKKPAKSSAPKTSAKHAKVKPAKK